MRLLRALFVMFALVAVAVLPGPSHAFAGTRTSHSGAHTHIGHPHGAHGEIASDEHGRLPSHHPCRCCSLACCAPATVADDAPISLPSALVLRLRLDRPAADRPRPDAEAQRRLKPPTASV